MTAQIRTKPGFIAALDQSGGSTPGALRQYGIPETAYSDDAGMFKLMHEMRVRIMTAPSFNKDRIIAAILFEATMDGNAQGKSVPAFLWEDRGVVPFLKVDKGLESEADGVQLMKPIPGLDALLERAVGLGVFGTKMRSVIKLDSKQGIPAIVRQQFELGAQIEKHGLMPILEPEVSIKSPEKAAAEKTLLTELLRGLDALPANVFLMRGLEGEPVVRLHAPQPIEQIDAEGKQVTHLLGDFEGELALPAREARATADWTRDALEGRTPVPPAIARQVAIIAGHCKGAGAARSPLKLVSSK